MIDFGFSNIIEEKIYIKDIPVILLSPKNTDSRGTIVLYHGWSSSKETQRIRGFILASVGYRVAIPDAINHGERDPFSEYGLDKGDELWNTVFKNIEEWDILVDGLVRKYGIDRKKIGVIGNSMGGITAGGIYTYNEYVKALVVMNGSMAWKNSIEIIKDAVKEQVEKAMEKNIAMKLDVIITEKLKEMEEEIAEVDPINNINLLVERPILLLHGDSDDLVSVESERLFFNQISPEYKDKDKIKYVEYPGLNHIVSTNMMEEAIIFFNKYL